MAPALHIQQNQMNLLRLHQEIVSFVPYVIHIILPDQLDSHRLILMLTILLALVFHVTTHMILHRLKHQVSVLPAMQTSPEHCQHMPGGCQDIPEIYWIYAQKLAKSY